MELAEKMPGRHEVHVWIVELAGSAEAMEACAHTLSADEKQRASQFRFEHLTVAFTLARGGLRILLGRYLDVEPARIRLAYGPRGKPRLAFPDAALEFNLAHSGNFAAYAFAHRRELGIDIEQVRPVPDQDNIVRRFFSPEECAEWSSLGPSQRDEAFFSCWTRKEAYIKALGDGLSMPLDGFRMSLLPGEPAALLHADGDPAASSRWMIHSFAPGPGYAGALAVPDRSCTVRILPPLIAGAVLDLTCGKPAPDVNMKRR